MALVALSRWAIGSAVDLLKSKFRDLDGELLIMSSFDLQKFISAVVQEHALATGLKQLSRPLQIAEFARSKGFDVTTSEWIRAAWLDQLQLSDQDLERVWSTDPEHWSWAFQQISAWRALLMEGALDASPQPTTAPAPLSDADKDQLLIRFIELARRDETLKQQIKEAKNDSEIIDLAQSLGYPFDSLTLLRQWSQHTDFSKPTWLGWFQ